MESPSPSPSEPLPAILGGSIGGALVLGILALWCWRKSPDPRRPAGRSAGLPTYEHAVAPPPATCLPRDDAPKLSEPRSKDDDEVDAGIARGTAVIVSGTKSQSQAPQAIEDITSELTLTSGHDAGVTGEGSTGPSGAIEDMAMEPALTSRHEAGAPEEGHMGRRAAVKDALRLVVDSAQVIAERSSMPFVAEIAGFLSVLANLSLDFGDNEQSMPKTIRWCGSMLEMLQESNIHAVSTQGSVEFFVLAPPRTLRGGSSSTGNSFFGVQGI